MSSYILGNIVRISTDTPFSVDGTATDPTTVTFTVWKHVAPPTAPTYETFVHGTDAEVENDAVGEYHMDYEPDSEGLYYYRVTGDGGADAAAEGSFFITSHLP